MSMRIQIVIPNESVRTLYDLCDRERRTPRDEASVLLAEALKRRAAALRRMSTQHMDRSTEGEVRHAAAS
jgi:hypothetical protein